MLMIYQCFGQKSGSFQSMYLKLNSYILVPQLMYIFTTLMALLSYLLTKVLDLGIIMDNNINYSLHISLIVSKPRSKTSVILEFLSRIIFLFSGQLTPDLFVRYLNMPHMFGTHLFSSIFLIQKMSKGTLPTVFASERLAVLNLDHYNLDN